MFVEYDAEWKDLEEEEGFDGHHVLADFLDVLPSAVRLKSSVVEGQLHHHVQSVEDRFFFNDLNDYICLVKMFANFLQYNKRKNVASRNKTFFTHKLAKFI